MAEVMTLERFEMARSFASDFLARWAETGEVPEFAGEEFDFHAAREELEAFWEKHRAAIVGSGVDYAFSLIQAAVFPELPLDEYEAIVQQMDGDQVLAEAKTQTARTWVLAERVAKRREAVEDARVLARKIARGALAAGLSLALAAL